MEEKHKKWICLGLFLIAMIVCFTTGCGKDFTSGDIEGYHYEETEEITNYVKIVTNKDKVILIELYPEIAQITVENFQKLVSEHFYDNLTFHRVIANFMIQTGDPTATGAGGSDKKIQGEFSLNGIENTLKHEKGIVSMARSSDYDSASSQFFICVSDNLEYLDGSYAAFGRVIAGYDAVEEISNVQTDGNNKPTTTQKMETVRFVNVTKQE